MADKTLIQLSTLAIPSTGTVTYAVKDSESYQLTVDKLASLIFSSYNVFRNPLSAGLITTSNAEVILAGLNNATSAQLNFDRVNLTGVFFDIDGGTFQDTYVGTSTFDGGAI